MTAVAKKRTKRAKVAEPEPVAETDAVATESEDQTQQDPSETPLAESAEDDDSPLLEGGELDPERAAMLKEAEELRAQVKALELRLSRVNEMDLAIIDAELRVADLQMRISEVDAERKELKESLKQAVAELRSCVNRRRTGQRELFKPDDFRETPVEPTQEAAPADPIDENATAPLTTLLAKEMKKVVGPDEFKAAKDRGEPIGMTEKQLEVLEAQGWKTIGDIEKAMRENAWWHQELKGFGPDKIDRLTITLAAFRRVFPMPAATDSVGEVVDAEYQVTPDSDPEAPEGDATPQAWEQAIEDLESLLSDANDLTYNGPGESIEFAESVTQQATEMLGWVREHQHVTEEQQTAIGNWRGGIDKWKAGG